MKASGGRLLWVVVCAPLRVLPTLAGVVILSFVLMQIVPGDAADVMAGESGTTTAETMAMLKIWFGLDQPMLARFAAYIKGLLHFSLGKSPRYDVPVMDLILQRLLNTLLLMGTALAFAFVTGVAGGAVMATYVNRWPDRLLSTIMLLFYSVPNFWTGLMLVLLFLVGFGVLPSGGSNTIGANLAGWSNLADIASHLILLALALSSFYMAVYAGLT